MLSVRIIILLLSLCLVSCNSKNTEKITVFGKVTDSVSGKPIRNAKVTVLCWYDAGWDKTDYESQDLNTNSNGDYEITFEEGYKVIVTSVATKYSVALQERNNFKSPSIQANLILDKSNPNVNAVEINLKDYIISNSDSE
jgi:hypothetical protein